MRCPRLMHWIYALEAAARARATDIFTVPFRKSENTKGSEIPKRSRRFVLRLIEKGVPLIGESELHIERR